MAQTPSHGQTPGATTARRIALLPPHVIERIAAGEVIERPASVARELIDNALDAGATTLRIEIREGGLRLVRVADDGCGIPADELELACQPHTTNKLRSLADLDALATLGFRGEALSSIAAVADMEIASATDDAGLAPTLTLSGGQEAARGHVPRARGTSVTVRELLRRDPCPSRAATRTARRGQRRARGRARLRLGASRGALHAGQRRNARIADTRNRPCGRGGSLLRGGRRARSPASWTL